MLHLSGIYRRSENFGQKIRNVLGQRNVKTPWMAPASFRDGASARIINIKYIFLMKIVNLGTMPSVVNCYMAQLRDVNYQKNRTLFRGNLERIGHAMAYELSRTLNYSLKEVQTPLGVKPVPTYDDHIVVGTVLRAGLAFHQGFLDVFDQADAGFVGTVA